MDIAEPIAVTVRDDEKFPHVVLLLPGGQDLEAVGSYDGNRVRGLRVVLLTPIQIQNVLQKKDGEKEQVARTRRGTRPHKLGNSRNLPFCD